MQANTRLSLTINDQPQECLYPDQVKRSRIFLLNEFRSMPEPFGTVLERQYNFRLQNKAGAETAPWLLADVLGIDISPDVEKLGFAWLLLHFYILFTDDCLDEIKIENREFLQIASGLCLQRALTGIFSNLPSFAQSGHRITNYFNEMAEGVYDELLASKNQSAPDLQHLYKKMASAKLWTSILFHYKGQEHHTDTHMKTINELLTAFQLRDDLIDWEQDWKQNRNSIPLHQTFSRLMKMGINKKRQHFTADEVFVGLITTSVFEEFLNFVNGSLEALLSKLKIMGRKISARWIKQCIIENRQVIKDIVSSPLQLPNLEKERNFKWFSNYVEQDYVKDVIRDLQGKITTTLVAA